MATHKLDQIMEEMSPDAERLLRRALLEPHKDKRLGHVELAELLRRRGYEVSEAAVRRWRTEHGG